MRQINFNFSHQLTESPFAYTNTISNLDENDPTVSNIRLVNMELTEIPICLIPVYEKNASLPDDEKEDILYLQYSNYRHTFRNRKLTGPKIIDVLDDIYNPFLYTINKKSYILGKGLLIYKNEGVDEILYMVTTEIKKGRIIKNPNATRIYISPNLQQEHKFLYTLINKEFLNGTFSDITMTKNCRKYLGLKLNLPTFATFKEEDIFMKDIFIKSLLTAA